MSDTDMENEQFKEWMDDYETELREGVQKRFGLTDETSENNRLSDERPEKEDDRTPSSR
jgi:hypothetical protein